VDFESQDRQLDQFEQDLQQVLERRPAPPSLKRKIMEQRAARQARGTWWQRLWAPFHAHTRIWVQVTATLILVALLGGGVKLGVEKREEDRRGEEAKQQVMTALKITSKALNQVHVRLAEHDRQ
jgi:hypothetical protein